jgi:hypothetical protein
MKNRWLIAALGLLLAGGMGGLVLTYWRVGSLPAAVGPMVAQAGGPLGAEQANAAQVAGDYSGVVNLQVTVAGVYSDTLPTQPISGTPDLGSIDLGLSISQAGNVLTGYVNLDKTLVFSVEHTI